MNGVIDSATDNVYEGCVSADGRQWTNFHQHAAWERVSHICKEKAVGMCWDGCHKIYLLMDERSVIDILANGYEIYPPNGNLVDRWYVESCGLRYVTAISGGSHRDENFQDVIPQLFWQSP